MRFLPPSRRQKVEHTRSLPARAAAAAAQRRAAATPPPRAIESLEPRTLLSTYYVATGGSDTNAGSVDYPFRTIQRAADLAAPGDTVFIRGGTYRESVKPARSGTAAAPITYRAYRNESVTVSGADVVTGWASYDGSVYRARQGWDLGAGDNQVFVDGRMMVEARWPNTSLDLSHPTHAVADRINANINGDNSTAVLYDSALTQPDGYWNGATIHIAPGQGWVMQTGTVLSYTRGRIVYSYQQMNQGYETPENGDRYFLSGKFQALDGAGEWYRQGDGSLYLRTAGSDSPAGHTVEAKRRQWAFDLRNLSHVAVEGVRLFASTIATNGSSDSIRLQGLNVEYVSHHALQRNGWSRPDATGILLLGTNSVLRDSTIAFSSSHGVTVSGTGNTVENNVIHDIGYGCGDDAGVLVRGSDQTVTRNTIYNAARDGIKTSRAYDIRVTHNVIHDVMLQTTDGGAIYTYGTDGRGAEFAYNIIYNVRAGGFGGVGVYLDNFSSNHLVHHNVVWNADHALKMNPTSRYNEIFNNTLVGQAYSVATSKSGDMLGSVFRNNIFTKTARIDPAARRQSILWPGKDPRFVNPAGGDFRLQADSPAINSGVEVTLGSFGGTRGYVGSRPDIGAYEFGKAPWKAGADLASARPSPDPDPEPVPGPQPAPQPTVKWARGAKIQAEGYDGQSGTRKGRTVVGYLSEGDWLRYDGVDFGDGSARTFRSRLSVGPGWEGKKIELRLGSPTGRLVGTLTTQSTGDWASYQEQSTTIEKVTGVQTLYLVFSGGEGVASIDCFRFV